MKERKICKLRAAIRNYLPLDSPGRDCVAPYCSGYEKYGRECPNLKVVYS
jgi:hypothetical protein